MSNQNSGSRGPTTFISTSANDSSAVQWLNQFFVQCAKDNVLDVTFHRIGDETRVMVYRDGAYTEIDRLDSKYGQIISDKIRARAKLSGSERRKAQDGRISLKYPDSGVALDIRVNIIPTIGGGESICLRLLDQSQGVVAGGGGLSSLHLPAISSYAIESLLAEPNGLILVTGPTGSGKTTSLYAIMSELDNGSRKIITVEDPVEYVNYNYVQVNVDPQHLTFAQALRAVLRQKPDIVLVGEIRDAETAKIAVEASNTGHLVLATLHTNTAVDTVSRMVELGTDPQSLAVALRMVMNQRLVPRYTGTLRMATEAEAAWINMHGMPARDVALLNEHCPDLEKVGMMPLLELLVVNQPIREAITDEDFGRIADLALKQPWYHTIAQAGVLAALKGECLLSDVMQRTGNKAGKREVMRPGMKKVQDGEATLDQVMQALEIQTRLKFHGSDISLASALDMVISQRGVTAA